MINCLPRIIDPQTKILIIGTVPGETSLENGQYYANPGNHFWKIIGYVTRENLSDKSYDEKIKTLGKNHIGLWDAIKESERESSLDKNVKNTIFNDLNSIKMEYPNIEIIVFNGKTLKKSKGGRLFLRNLNVTYRFAPSSSGASTHMKLHEKKVEWKNVLAPFIG